MGEIGVGSTERQQMVMDRVRLSQPLSTIYCSFVVPKPADRLTVDSTIEGAPPLLFFNKGEYSKKK